MNPVSDDICPSGYGPYEPSIASSASSSQNSVFSDTLSAQSSIATSFSDDFRSIHEDPQERDRILAQTQLRFHGIDGLQGQELPALCKLPKPTTSCPTYADITSVPAPQRQHPRRCSASKGQNPPPLVRQRDRKINFVDNLVDSATQMVEVIWPLSSVLCKSDSGERAVLPLRTYIEETLRRSRTSYSTLQVALYYLILIRPYVPKSDFTMELFADCPAERALMCGRRMFLTALILASKYLQDRNYSAKAWSKMSGLKVCEINSHERCFLSKVGWKLHLPKPLFERWQEIVLRYTPTPSASPPAGVGTSTWQRMVPLLTPELDNMPYIESALMGCPLQLPSRESMSCTPTPTNATFNNARLEGSESPEHTPTPRTALPPPRFLEPKPDLAPRMTLLPTPNLTPQSTAANTPAASGYERSMCQVMRDMTNFDTRHPMTRRPSTLLRRPSMMSSSSYNSSPESMMSDHSRSSRSSSISSISTVSTNSSLAPNRACLARQATCRNAGLPPLRLVKEEVEGTSLRPIVIDDTEMGESPEMIDFSQSEKVLHAPHRHSRAAKHAPQTTSVPAAVKISSKKRGRPSGHGHRRSELQEEVRYLLEESFDDDDVDMDDDSLSEESPAVTYTSTMLGRVPMQKNEGKKRTCCSTTSAMSVSPMPLYGEVV